jgi:hypothetical protein
VNAVNDAPIAQNKNYSAQANMAITGLSGLLTGVTDADTGVNGCTPAFSVAGVSATSPAGGVISNLNAAAGTFDFEPPPGVTGNVTFTYTVSDNGCPGTATSALATVTVAVGGPVIWFVDSTAPAGGNGTWTGTNSKAFQTLAQAAAVDASDHRIFVLNNSGSSINYAGGITLNTGEWLVGQGATGASFDSTMSIAPPVGTVARPGINGVRPTFAGTVQMNTQSASNVVRLLGFNLSTGGSTALTNGGTTINGVTTALGSVTTTTGTAVSITGVNNGSTTANSLTFVSVSSSGAPNGIAVNNLTGSFTVTGASGAGSGGTINGSTGPGISLTNTGPVSLSLMNVQNGGDDGIQGNGVGGLTLSNVTISSNGNAVGERGIDVTELTGSGGMTSTTVTGSAESNVRIANTAGTLTAFNVTASTFSTTNFTTGDDGFLVEQNGTGTMNLSLIGNTFTDNKGDHFQVASDADAVGAINFTFSGNTLTTTAANDPNVLGGGITISPSGSTDVTFTINGNNIQQAFDDAINLNLGTASTAAASMIGTVSNNTIGSAGAVDSGSESSNTITVTSNGAGVSTVAVTGNQVFQYSNAYGIFVTTKEGSSTLNATITGNTIANPGTFAINGIHFQAGATASDNGLLCAVVTGNNATGAGHPAVPDADIRLRQRFSTTIRLPGYAGASSDTTAVNSFVSGNNDPAGATPAPLVTSVHNVGGGGSGFVGGAVCPTPP